MMSHRSLKNCSNIFTNFLRINFADVSSFKPIFARSLQNINLLNQYRVSAASFHTSFKLQDISGLNDFFDDPKNWGEQEVKVGRAWKKDELRLKSNEDLHKLWYVLLKEKNMLLTMEAASKEEDKLFPNPERIDKCELSMNNLEAVIRERDNAYMLLETGETLERQSDFTVDGFGRKLRRKFKEFTTPDYMHLRVANSPFNRNPVRTKFSRLLREKEQRMQVFRNKKLFNYVCRIIKEYPDVDIDALKQKYPDVDIEKARKSKRALGNHNQNIGGNEVY